MFEDGLSYPVRGGWISRMIIGGLLFYAFCAPDPGILSVVPFVVFRRGRMSISALGVAVASGSTHTLQFVSLWSPVSVVLFLASRGVVTLSGGILMGILFTTTINIHIEW